jgi:hypothetical protein
LLPGAELAVRTDGAIRRGLAEHISMTVISSAAKIRFREDLVFEPNTAICSVVELQHHEHISAHARGLLGKKHALTVLVGQ